MSAFFFKNAYKTATSRFVFLNDNFMPFSSVNFSKKTTVVQLWHGQGAFKKFGLDSSLSESERVLAKKCSEKYDCIVVSSKNVSEIYASAFGVSEEKIIPCGVPDSDYFFDEKNRNKFRREYFIDDGKKIVLYAPTFRENCVDGGNILDMFSVKRFVDELGED
ncbi:MAG: CDP-glycerol glycerophosphotransferase family protein, partial [Clostridia bacterium]|nr:CDP-glycerol glycerophosphotransferase family protein [Clostridia bacterium]